MHNYLLALGPFPSTHVTQYLLKHPIVQMRNFYLRVVFSQEYDWLIRYAFINDDLKVINFRLCLLLHSHQELYQ